MDYKHKADFINLLSNSNFGCWSGATWSSGSNVGNETGTTVTADNWVKTSGLKTYRIDGSSTYYKANPYSLKITSVSTQCEMYWPNSLYNISSFYNKYKGDYLTFGAYVYGSQGSVLRLFIDDNGSPSYSNYHSGSGGYEWLSTSRLIGSSADRLKVGFEIAGSAGYDFYISNSSLVRGPLVPGFGIKQNEIVYFDTALTSSTITGTVGNVAWTSVNFRTDSSNKIPAGIKALKIYTECSDAESASGPNSAYLALSLNGSNTYYANSPAGLTNGLKNYVTDWVPVNTYNNTFYYMVQRASASSNTFTITSLKYLAAMF